VYRGLSDLELIPENTPPRLLLCPTLACPSQGPPIRWQYPRAPPPRASFLSPLFSLNPSSSRRSTRSPIVNPTPTPRTTLPRGTSRGSWGLASRAVLAASGSTSSRLISPLCGCATRLFVLWLSQVSSNCSFILLSFSDIGLPNQWSRAFHVLSANRHSLSTFLSSVLYPLISFVPLRPNFFVVLYLDSTALNGHSYYWSLLYGVIPHI